jgi:hypothetical protein
MKRSGEIDVDAIFHIDSLLDTEEGSDEVPPERAAWYDEFSADDEDDDD